MLRKRTQTWDTVSDSAITWFFIGLLMIAAIAALLGQIAVD